MAQGVYINPVKVRRVLIACQLSEALRLFWYMLALRRGHPKPQTGY
jgi:hypothetical protein